jgi:hypothetical protein
MTSLEEYLVAHPEHAPADKVIVFDELNEPGTRSMVRRSSAGQSRSPPSF